MRAEPDLRRALRELSGVVLPSSCPGCGLADRVICPDCRSLLLGPAADVRRLAGGLAPCWRGLRPPAVAVAGYSGPVRRLLVQWKDHGRTDLTPLVARALARSVTGSLRLAHRNGALQGGDVVWLVGVPSSPAATRRRGENLLRSAAALAVPTVARAVAPADLRVALADALVQRRGVVDQAGLDARERQRNLAGRVALSRTGLPLAGPIVLIDDVLTTGASLAECASTLEAASMGPIVGAAVVAVTPARRRRTTRSNVTGERV